MSDLACRQEALPFKPRTAPFEGRPYLDYPYLVRDALAVERPVLTLHLRRFERHSEMSPERRWDSKCTLGVLKKGSFRPTAKGGLGNFYSMLMGCLCCQSWVLTLYWMDSSLEVPKYGS